MSNDPNQIISAEWTFEIRFHAKRDDHARLAIERLRAMADHLEKYAKTPLMEEVLDHLQGERSATPFGGMTGAESDYKDISSGWRGLWRVATYE